MSGDYTRFTYDPLRDFDRVRIEQGRVLVDADLNELSDSFDHRLRALALDVLGPCTAPVDQAAGPGATASGFKIESAGTSFTIGLGRLYLHGLELDNHGSGPYVVEPGLKDERGQTPVPYESQPYYPKPPAVPADGLDHLVYVDAWEREVTAASDRSLVDSAIGFDTAARMQTVWQVKVLTDDASGVACSTPDDKVPGYAQKTAPSGARLTVAAVGVPADDDPCSVPGVGGYRGWDNRLYRVEVHDGGDLSSATFKWSHDNASVETAVITLDSTRTVLAVVRTGRDDVQRIREGAWVEVTDENHELNAIPGHLAQVTAVDAVDDMSQSVTISLAVPGDFDPSIAANRTRVRQWDHTTTTSTIPASSASAGYVLEQGIQVTFSQEGTDPFRTGDFWTFAARSADASLQTFTAAPPHGPIHFYGRLAIWGSGQVQDCRTIWPTSCDCSCEGECTQCVTPQSHASGQLTIQMAIDNIEAIGGTVCLAAGRYAIDAPIRIRKARGLTVKGHRYATFISYSGVGPAFIVETSLGVRLLDLTVLLHNQGLANPANPVAPSMTTAAPSMTFKERVAAQDTRVAANAAKAPSGAANNAAPAAPATGAVAPTPTVVETASKYSVPVAGFAIVLCVGVEITGCVVFDASLLQQYSQLATAATSAGAALGTHAKTLGIGSAGVITAGVVAGLALRDCIFVAAFGITSLHSQALAGAYLATMLPTTAGTNSARYSMLVGVEVSDTILLGVRAGIWWDEAVVATEVVIEKSLCAGILSAGIAWHSSSLTGHNVVRGAIVRGTGAGIHNTSSSLTVERSLVMASFANRLGLNNNAEPIGDSIALADPLLEGTVRDIVIRGCVLQAARYAVSAVGRSTNVRIDQNVVKSGLGGVVQESGSSGLRWVITNNDVEVLGSGSAVQPDSTLAGIWLSQAYLAEVRSNRIHDIGSAASQPYARVGVALEDCETVVVSENVLINIVGGGRPLVVAGLHAFSSIGRLDITGNVIAIDGQGTPSPASDIVNFTPVFIETGLVELAYPQAFGRAAADPTKPLMAMRTQNADTAAASQPGPASPPAVISPYVVRALDTSMFASGRVLRLATYGAYYYSSSGGGAVAAHGNSIDTHGVQPAINVSTLGNLMLGQNRVRHAGSSGYNGFSVITADADSMVVDGNYVEAPVDPNAGNQSTAAMALAVVDNRIAISTNVTQGGIYLNGSALPPPWAPLNVELH